MLGFFKRLFDDNARELRRLAPKVDAINALEGEIEALSDDDLRAETDGFRRQLEQGATLDDLMVRAFAVVREAARRTLGMRHYDVQLIGGMALHMGRIAEMKTGEGKTLVATLPAYLNALEGRGVHIVTVNDYLARRDSEWMGQVYRFLGLDVGLIVHGLDRAERRRAYAADITYGTNNEFGFDYLRDNMALYERDLVQRELNYAIVDEVDSILIDEARTPLIISGQTDTPTDLYVKCARLAGRMKRDVHYEVDEKARSIELTDEGIAMAEKGLGVDNIADLEAAAHKHGIENAIRAKELFKRDVDYMVRDGQVIIVDEFTGRLMFGRRYSDGQHQAIEAKEGLKIERESQTLASITFQNYFRMYDKLAGMTGTAETEAEEFASIYGLNVLVIPTNEPMVREDQPDVIHMTKDAKYEAVIEDIAETHGQGRPVLVGTISIETSEHLSRLLKRRGIPHQVLNARYHEQEAEIVAQAGQPGAVTIATNMAGRGTDIVLGGNADFLARRELRKHGYEPEIIAVAAELTPSNDPEVLAARRLYEKTYAEMEKKVSEARRRVLDAGGLHIIGTERHESRRIDNQLRGRAGRQGDPGMSRFYLSLEDDLMRLFGSENIRDMLDRIGVEEGEPIEHPWISRAIENAQRRVESRNFSMRKTVLEYDDVLNKQREVIYRQRRQVLQGEPLRDQIIEMMEPVAESAVAAYSEPDSHPADWDLAGLVEHVNAQYLTLNPLTMADLGDPEELEPEDLVELFREALIKEHRAKEEMYGSEMMRELERVILLRVVDSRWMEHLAAMDGLRDGIGLRAYAQRDPLIEYTKESYDMFQEMVRQIQADVVRNLLQVRVAVEGGAELKRHSTVGKSEAVRARVPAMAAGAGPVPGAASPGAGGDGVLPPAGGPSAGGRGPGAAARGGRGQPPAPQQPRRVEKVGRNDPCPCGSGKKYKRCCGR